MTLVKCAACTMIYADPISPDMASGRYYHQAGEDYYLSKNKLAGDYATVRFERELSLFRKFCPSGKILDVGCSTGGFLYQLTRRFPGAYDLMGTDVSGPALDYAASKGLKVLPGDFLRIDLTNLDAVTFWAVLEHLENPRAFLEKAARMLKPNGLCFVLVPNFGSLAVRLLGSRYRYIYPQHVNYFTQRTVAHLVEPRFEIIHTRYTHFNPIVIWQDWRRAGKDVSNQERAELLARTNRMKQIALFAPARALYRLTESAVGSVGLADNIAVVFRKRDRSAE